MATDLRADASPKKEFFVRMLTRDISLQDCILDLIDNSIDAAWRSADEEPKTLVVDKALQEFKIEIVISADEFRISDNCSGISLDDAAQYAFTFGRDPGQEADDYSVGVYGIGMKRAVFKLGASIEVRSTYGEDGSLEAFMVPINVGEWLSSDAWDFDIEPMDAAPTPGVTISVSSLHDDTREFFGDEMYARRLRRILSRDYMVPLMRGLQLLVNGTPVTAAPFELRQSDNFAPMRHRYLDGGVEIEIVAGMVALPPDDNEPDEDRGENPSGWYVACNGRIVLAADRTILTGWGDTLPSWHRQYSGFAGIAFFSAEDPTLLPMTTTKRSVDASAAVYRRALGKMFEPTRAWIDYTNARKSAAAEAIKSLEEPTSPADLVNVEPRETVSLPTITRAPPREPMANVNYAVPRKRMQALAEAFGDRNMTYRDVGSSSFEYAYEELVDESGA